MHGRRGCPGALGHLPGFSLGVAIVLTRFDAGRGSGSVRARMSFGQLCLLVSTQPVFLS